MVDAADALASSSPLPAMRAEIRRVIRRRNIVYSSPLAQNNDLPPSDPMSESEWDRMPALDVIVDSEEEDEDEDYLPALLKVPDEEELTDDEEGSDSEDGSNQFEHTPVARRIEKDAHRGLVTTIGRTCDIPTHTHNNSWQHPAFFEPNVHFVRRAKFTAERATQRRLHTVQTLKDTAAAEKKAADAAKAQELEDAEKEMNAYCDEVLSSLEERGYSLADLMEYRWCGFFAHKPVVKQILSYWSSTRAPTTRTFIWNWVYQLVRKVVVQEAQRITSSGMLRKTKKTVNEEFFLKFSLRGISRDRIEGVLEEARGGCDKGDTAGESGPDRTRHPPNRTREVTGTGGRLANRGSP
ncbi:hypothetical protein C8J57DRAFT_1246501 [Mycena rebaudengoi]|nr:hypothetical protein C8J57DRAFT_1246501 [Mycena rebaudengoi]